MRSGDHPALRADRLFAGHHKSKSSFVCVFSRSKQECFVCVLSLSASFVLFLVFVFVLVFVRSPTAWTGRGRNATNAQGDDLGQSLGKMKSVGIGEAKERRLERGSKRPGAPVRSVDPNSAKSITKTKRNQAFLTRSKQQ